MFVMFCGDASLKSRVWYKENCETEENVNIV